MYGDNDLMRACRILLCRDFRVVVSGADGFFLSHIGALSGSEDVVCAGLFGDGRYSLTLLGSQGQWYDFEQEHFLRPVPMGCLDLECHADSEGLFRLRHRGGAERIFCPSGDGKAGFCPVGDVGADDGFFRLVSVEEFEALRDLVCSRWVLGPSGELAVVDEGQSTYDFVHFGGLRVLYEDLLRGYRDCFSGCEFFFFCDVDVYRAVRFRPALFYVVFGEGVLSQFAASLESLVDPGGYKGDILVATDLSEARLEALMAEGLEARLRCFPMRGHDITDYVTARQTLFSCGGFDGYGPVVYLDADVVVDVPLEPLLCHAALERCVSAQLEFFHEDFRKSPSSGGPLWEQDPFPVLCVEEGFNGGVFLVPDVMEQRRYLDAAFYTSLIYNNDHGRGSVPFNEQGVLNYALRKMNDFDGTFITQKTATGGNPGSYIVRHYGSMLPSMARGFLHFWCVGGGSRGDTMQRYIARLRDYNARDGKEEISNY